MMKLGNRIRGAAASTIFAAASIVALGAGCGDVQADFCDALCECQNCGEKGLERCEVSIQSQLDVAETYGCLEQAEAFFACATERVQALNEEQCDSDSLEIDTAPCQALRDDYDDCTKDASRREPGAY
jgi:hypothetical protein